MFAQQKDTVEFPDGSVTIRKLSWKSLEKAKEAQSITAATSLRAYGGDLMKALRSDTVNEAAKLHAEKKASQSEQVKARYAEYDREAVLSKGIDSWSYGELNPERILELEEETADKLHRAILDLSLPPIDKEAAEVIQGKF